MAASLTRLQCSVSTWPCTGTVHAGDLTPFIRCTSSHEFDVDRRLPKGSRPQQMSEFDLSECKLSVADLIPFQNIQRLDLSRNLLTWPKLKK